MPNKYKASVKVMKSHDYCHFEVCLGVGEDENLTAKQVDKMMNEAQRICDLQIKKYQAAKSFILREASEDSFVKLRREVSELLSSKPSGEFSPEEKAKIKALHDHAFSLRFNYDEYEYDYEEEDEY